MSFRGVAPAMSGQWSRREALRGAALSAAVAAAGCLGLGASPEQRLRDHADELEKLADVGAALEAGYRTAGRYVRSEAGVLGEPFLNAQIQGVEPTEPHAVLFDLTDEGTYEPLGLKWFVPAEGREDPPTLFGREFDGPFGSEAGVIPEHYALHAWLFRENPDGVFARYNPAVEVAPLVEAVAPVREALAPFRLGSTAEKRGYANTEKCVTVDGEGYGVPFERTENAGSGGTDPQAPPVLLYRLTSNWSYRLLGAEWYVPADGASSPPELFGRQFHDPTDGHSPEVDQPRHYGLHAWLFRANPEGMFARYHPTVTC